MRTLVVIPTYLEADNITDVLTQVRAAAPSVDILVVDDNSSDGTADLARKAGEELGQVDVLVRPGKGGLGVAYRAGFEVGFERGYEALVQMDADFQHPPTKLAELLERIEQGADVAIGSRYVPGGSTPNWPMRRRAISRIGNFYASRMLGLHVNDATAGFRAYRAELLKQLESASTRATGYGFQVELNYRAHRLGATIVEVPITFTDRTRGVSKMSWHIIGEAMTLVSWWGLRDRLQGTMGGSRRRRAGSRPFATGRATTTTSSGTAPTSAPAPTPAAASFNGGAASAPSGPAPRGAKDALSGNGAPENAVVDGASEDAAPEGAADFDPTGKEGGSDDRRGKPIGNGSDNGSASIPVATTEPTAAPDS